MCVRVEVFSTDNRIVVRKRSSLGKDFRLIGGFKWVEGPLSV